ncbi:unnamed protein product [Euphydryas editha]|uniref:Uncharacterized protein n=1 Tax=Euphydryas editha TaxID=104508 RepID=A0AAU9TD06_EUPED|nr:unnamed protein product [Euphydryas editha]
MHLLDDNSENVMENSFRNVITMNGSKYIFKRDFFWRTWREVKNESGYSSVIEEKPPKCPYEILSLKTEQESCVVNYTQYFKQFNSCPSSISLRDLQISCGNPVETKWQILKTYKKNFTERNTAVICQGRENCDILTLYSFLPDYISFRIINSTNNVFYSRIMKAGHKNYICINDCGIYDPKTKEITKIEKPLTVDLLKNVKKKRENSNLHKNYNKMNRIKNNMLLKNGLHYKEPKRKKIGDILKVKDTLFINNKRNEELATKSQCKKIEEQYLEIEEDDSYYYDFNEI